MTEKEVISAVIVVLSCRGNGIPVRSGLHVSLNPVVKSCPMVGDCHENSSIVLVLETTVNSATGYASARKQLEN